MCQICCCVLSARLCNKIRIIIATENKRNDVFAHDSKLQGYTGQVAYWANEMNFSVNHDRGAGTLQKNNFKNCSPSTTCQLHTLHFPSDAYIIKMK